MVTAWRWAGGKIRPWTPTGSRSATTIIAVRCRAGPVLRAPRVRWHGHTDSRNRTPASRLSTRRQMLVGYGVVSSPTSPPIQPPRVRDLLVRALRATPRGNKTPRNGGWWGRGPPPPPDGDRGGLRRDATTKRGLLRGLGRDLTWAGWGRIWLGGGVGMSRSRPLSKLTGWYGWGGRYRISEALPPISPAASPDYNYATADTKAIVATCASTSTAAADSTNNLRAEPHTTTTVPRPDQYQRQPRPQSSPDSDSLFPVTATEPRVIDESTTGGGPSPPPQTPRYPTCPPRHTTPNHPSPRPANYRREPYRTIRS